MMTVVETGARVCVCTVTVLCTAGVYNRCVYKFDHYCVWIGNCIGGLNHRYFLALLMSLSVMSVHGVWAHVNVFSAAVTVHRISTDDLYHLVQVNYTHSST